MPHVAKSRGYHFIGAFMMPSFALTMKLATRLRLVRRTTGDRHRQFLNVEAGAFLIDSKRLH